MAVTVEKVGNRIQLRATYRPDVPGKCKEVHGGRWSPAAKVWTYPLDWGTCVALRRTWGEELAIGPELRTWAREARAIAENMAALASGEIRPEERAMPYVTEQAPELAAALRSRDYQAVAVRYIESGRNVLIGDQPGMGKTLETIGGIIESGTTGPILVFCPVTAVKSTWARELAKWVPGDPVYCATGTKLQREKTVLEFQQLVTPGRKWLICNIEMVRVWIGDVCSNDADVLCKGGKARSRTDKAAAARCPSTHKETAEYQYPDLHLEPWSTIVVDESHKALICHAATLKKMTQTRCGMAMLPLRPNGLKIALSGTPWRGKAKNFWGTLNWLRPEVYTSYWRWAEKYFEIDNSGYGTDVLGLKDDMEDLFTEELKTIMLRRTKKECMKDLPDKAYVDVWLPLEGKQKTAYEAMAANAAVNLAGGTLMATGVLAEMTRLKQFATTTGIIDTRPVKFDIESHRGKSLIAPVDVDDFFVDEHFFSPTLPSNKFDWLVEFLAERGIDGDLRLDGGLSAQFTESKVVVASPDTKVINLFASALREMHISCHVLTGQTKAKDRAALVADFQDNPNSPRVFLLNTFAGGVSITLDAADDLVILNRTWIPDNEEQVEDRIHRASRIHNVTIYSIGSSGTIEETIASESLSRDDIQKSLMDGSRGVEFARKLLEA